MKTLVSPKGYEIQGTNDRLAGIGGINPEIDDSSIGDNTVEVMDAGDTEICWGSQETITDDRGMRQFVDSKGNLVWEGELHYIDPANGIVAPQRLFPEMPMPDIIKRAFLPQALDIGQLEDIHILIQRGIDDLGQTLACEADYTDEDRENAKATISVGEEVMTAIRQTMETLR